MPVAFAQFEQTEIVFAHLVHPNVSAGRRDADQIGVRAGQQVHQRHRVVDAGVDVDENGRFIASKIPGLRWHDANDVGAPRRN